VVVMFPEGVVEWIVVVVFGADVVVVMLPEGVVVDFGVVEVVVVVVKGGVQPAWSWLWGQLLCWSQWNCWSIHSSSPLHLKPLKQYLKYVP
jgi:hypothetical protein